MLIAIYQTMVAEYICVYCVLCILYILLDIKLHTGA